MTAYPVNAPWLTPTEKHIIHLCNEADRAQKARESYSSTQILSAFTDWRIYLWSVVFITTYIPVYSVILSLPSVVSGLGYSGTSATLMACPPYGVGFFVVLSAGWTIDKYGLRIWHYLLGCVVTMIALIVLMAVENLVVRYIMFFFVMFMYVPVPYLHFTSSCFEHD